MASRAAWEDAVESGDVWTQARLENPRLAEHAMVRIVNEDLGVECVASIPRDAPKGWAELLDRGTITFKAKAGAGGAGSSYSSLATPAPADASRECPA